MVKEVEELIKIVGKGNLLETLFIRQGSYQHANLARGIDCRNHFGLSAFIRKKEEPEEPLDKYFNLQFSLQGLFSIYAEAYKGLIENTQLNTQGVIDKIYISVSNDELEEQLSSIISGEQSTEDQKKLKLLNILANPKGKTLFNNNNDFEKQVLNNVKKLLKINYTNEFDKEFSLCKEVIDHYYSIHNIKVDKDIALLFSSYGIFSIHTEGKDKDVLSLNQYINEKAKMINTPLYYDYILRLLQVLSKIKLPSRDGTIKYTVDCENMDWQEEELKSNGSICPINKKNTLEQLLKNQNSDEFEQLVTSPENIYDSVQQEENECRPNFIVSKKKEKDHKNIVCKLILGMFILSVGLCVADYFFMEQKLFNSIKDVLPQNNLTNLIVGAVLTIVIVYALFQLLKSPQEPPLSTFDDVQNKKLEPLHAKQA
ncbi:hypothetical protein H9I48_01325 [Wolbachia pipientis]|uniref:WD1261 family protein n=1 Tax=Wolbachia pipientis TaxID=955 RepID=UPI0016515469|nr:hypothetical protein [Wolbachia pipientis]MBC6685899.1 hypothetical protein [Wolbachia pipientis]